MVQPKIGRILVELGYVSENELQKSLEIQKAEKNIRRLGEIICSLYTKEEEIIKALSIQFGIPLMSIEQLPEVMLIDKVSYDFLKLNQILPLAIDNGTMDIAISDPTNTDVTNGLQASLDYEINPFLTTGDVILEHLDKLQASKDTMMQQLLEGVAETETETVSETLGEISHLKDLAQEKGIVQLVNIILENAVKENSSDVHVEPEESGVRVRYRIDGILYEREMLPSKTQAALASRIKLISQMNIAERRLPQDGRIKGRFAGKDVDIRVSTLPTVYGESIVMRLLDKDTSFITIESIGFDAAFLKQYEKLIKKPHGMILITGPTGSGKSTTLYATLDKINSAAKKIITIEEPVEYLLKGINQIQVRPKIGLTFANGLKSIVRQDPDIIMVGEIRDLETARIAIHASLTGHLLFSTLHTNDSASAITRLIDMGIENYLVSSTLIGVIAQRLVRKVCPHCKELSAVPEEYKHDLADRADRIWQGSGCDNCMNTGYKGRVAIFEFLHINDEIRDLIMNKSTARHIAEKAIAKGMRTLRDDGIHKVLEGITTMDEVIKVTQENV